MKNKTSLKHFLPVMLSFYIMGFVDIVGVATGYIKNDFNLSNSTAQMLPFMVFIWFILVSIPTGVFQDRKGKKNTVNIGILITGLGLIIPFIQYSLITVIIGFAVLGIGNTILQVSANPLLLEISSKNTKAANLSLSQFIKAIASMLGPIITTGLAIYTGNWKNIFLIYAIMSIIVAIWLNSVKIPESKSDKKPATLKSVVNLLKNKYIIIMILAIFFVVGFDVTMNSSIANFLKNKFSISIESANFGISIYFAALMAGRFLGAFLLRILNTKKFLIISTLITLIGLIGLIFSNNILLTRILIFVSGFGFSNIFPIMFAIIVERKPEYANELSGLIILAVSGGAIIPPISGILCDLFSATASIIVLLACVAYISYASYYVIKN